MTVVRPAPVSDGVPVESGRRRARPVLGWAMFGVVALAVQLYIYAAWILRGHATPIGVGSDPVPGWMKVSLISQEVVFVVGGLAAVALFVVRPLLRERRLSWDGMAVIAAVSLVWWDPLYSYLGLAHTYNSYMTNVGSWASDVPGWLPPNGQNISQPIFWDLGVYVLVFCVALVPANALMRRARVHWPQLGTTGLVTLTYGGFILFDFVVEIMWLRLGSVSYGAAFGPFTLFRGTTYQFAVFEPLALGAVFAGLALLRFYRDDRGLSLAERGVDRIRNGPRTLLRTLALIGVFNALAAGYSIVVPLITVHATEWSRATEQRSYFMHGLCGAGTDVACPGSKLPVPRQNSTRVGPDGQLVEPGRPRT